LALRREIRAFVALAEPRVCLANSQETWGFPGCLTGGERLAPRVVASPAGFEPTAPRLGILCALISNDPSSPLIRRSRSQTLTTPNAVQPLNPTPAAECRAMPPGEYRGMATQEKREALEKKNAACRTTFLPFGVPVPVPDWKSPPRQTSLIANCRHRPDHGVEACDQFQTRRLGSVLCWMGRGVGVIPSCELRCSRPGPA